MGRAVSWGWRGFDTTFLYNNNLKRYNVCPCMDTKSSLATPRFSRANNRLPLRFCLLGIGVMGLGFGMRSSLEACRQTMS